MQSIQLDFGTRHAQGSPWRGSEQRKTLRRNSRRRALSLGLGLVLMLRLSLWLALPLLCVRSLQLRQRLPGESDVSLTHTDEDPASRKAHPGIEAVEVIREPVDDCLLVALRQEVQLASEDALPQLPQVA